MLKERRAIKRSGRWVGNITYRYVTSVTGISRALDLGSLVLLRIEK